MKKKGLILIFILFTSWFPFAFSATNEGYGEDQTALGQFVDSFENLNNVSVTYQVERNSTLNAMELNFTSFILNYENFSAYVETDPNNRITPDNYNVSWVGLLRSDSTRVVRDYGVGNVQNFNYSFEFSLTDLEAGDADSRGIMILMALDQSDSVGWGTIYTLLNPVQVGNNDAKYVIWMTTRDAVGPTTTAGTYQYDVGTIYYGWWFRIGTNKTLNVYTDPAMSNRVERLSHIKATSDYRYLQVVKSTAGVADPNDSVDGYIFQMYNETWGTGGYELNGYFTTDDYMNDTECNGTTLGLMVNTSIPANTDIQVQFSNDNATWGDWEGTPLGSNILDGGFETIDLRYLNETDIYMRFNLSTTDVAITPRIYQARIISTEGNQTGATPGPSGSGAIGFIMLILISSPIIVLIIWKGKKR